MSGTLPPAPVAGVGGAEAPASRGKKAVFAMGILGVGFVGFWMAGGLSEKKQVTDIGASPGAAGMMRPVSMPPPPEREPPPDTGTQAPARTMDLGQTRRAPPPRPIRAAPIMAFSDSETERPATAGRGASGDSSEDDELTTRLRSTKTAAARARRLRNPAMTITQGTLIPCIRNTPVNTQLPGMVSCIVPEDVYGTTGTVSLLDRGTRIVGRIQNAMAHGTNRAFIVWTRAETPDHVTIELDSPGTDALGTNGIAVDTNTNFWARFGGAIMLSFIDTGLQAAALGASSVANSGSGQSVSFNQFQGRGSGAASQAVSRTVNIPPFGTSPQGAAEAVFVARDLDFSSVYSLRSQ